MTNIQRITVETDELDADGVVVPGRTIEFSVTQGEVVRIRILENGTLKEVFNVSKGVLAGMVQVLK